MSIQKKITRGLSHYLLPTSFLALNRPFPKGIYVYRNDK